MATVHPKRTGLPFVVWISVKQGQQDVRVKVGRPPDFDASVSVRPDVRVLSGQLTSHHLGLVRQWIELNRDVIIANWNGEFDDSADAIEALKPLPKS